MAKMVLTGLDKNIIAAMRGNSRDVLIKGAYKWIPKKSLK